MLWIKLNYMTRIQCSGCGSSGKVGQCMCSKGTKEYYYYYYYYYY